MGIRVSQRAHLKQRVLSAPACDSDWVDVGPTPESAFQQASQGILMPSGCDFDEQSILESFLCEVIIFPKAIINLK